MPDHLAETPVDLAACRYGHPRSEYGLWTSSAHQAPYWKCAKCVELYRAADKAARAERTRQRKGVANG